MFFFNFGAVWNMIPNHAKPSKIAYPSCTIIITIAEKHSQLKLPEKGQKGFQPISGSNERVIGEVAAIVAKESGLSSATYKRAKVTIEKGTEEQKNKRIYIWDYVTKFKD